jgi:hypothetical protein
MVPSGQQEPEACLLYKYEKLEHGDSIRLIELHPASDYDSELKCTISLCRLTELGSESQSSQTDDISSASQDPSVSPRPTYEAISYVWGEPVFPETLYTSAGHFKITVSLATALRRFRLTSELRRLWADAVCINQTDDEEKGHQVAQMGVIFRTASRVLAWVAGTIRSAVSH